MLNPFIDLISNVIFIVNLALIIWVVIGLLMHFDIVNRHSPVVNRVYSALTRLLEPLLTRIRKLLGRFLPTVDGIDLSPIVLILLLHFINNALYSWFYIP
jgi:YggT family protein